MKIYCESCSGKGRREVDYLMEICCKCGGKGYTEDNKYEEIKKLIIEEFDNAHKNELVNRGDRYNYLTHYKNGLRFAIDLLEEDE